MYPPPPDSEPTRFINLDRFPLDDEEAEELHRSIATCTEGTIPGGWGSISYWSADLIEAGDWTPAIWRSPILAEASYAYANHREMLRLGDISDCIIRQTGRTLSGPFQRIDSSTPGSFPVVGSKGMDGQKVIKSTPDAHYAHKDQDVKSEVVKLLRHSGHLLITGGQDSSSARLTAVASNEKYIGGGWLPVTGLSTQQAKAIAVFLNSTPGRIQLMRNAGRKLEFPQYGPAASGNVRIPDVNDIRIMQILADCWERTKDMVVPQFRDGECEVRQLWDGAVAEAMGWDVEELTRLRLLLHREPHVSGLGYNQYRDEVGG